MLSTSCPIHYTIRKRDEDGTWWLLPSGSGWTTKRLAAGQFPFLRACELQDHHRKTLRECGLFGAVFVD